MAVYLDDTLLINPIIQDPITEGDGEIRMGTTPKAEVQKDALLMKSGELPVPLRVVKTTKVSPWQWLK